MNDLFTQGYSNPGFEDKHVKQTQHIYTIYLLLFNKLNPWAPFTNID